MTSINETLERYRQWGAPRMLEPDSLRLGCRVSDEPAGADEIREAWGRAPLPSEAHQLWQVAREAELFVDVDYGQWGLRLLTPAASAARTALEKDERPEDFEEADLVIGEFLGDGELVVLDRDGRVVIAAEIEPRPQWTIAADNLAQLLSGFFKADGQKYWEPSGLQRAE